MPGPVRELRVCSRGTRSVSSLSADPQRLQWIGYRDYKGQKQYVTIMLASQGKYFAQHEDTMYGVLYSTEMGE